MKEPNKERTVVYWNIPVGPQFNSREYVKKYRSIPDDDNSWRIPYVKVGQISWNKDEEPDVYTAIRKKRGGNRTGYVIPFSMEEIIEFPFKIKGKNADTQIRKLLFNIAMSIDTHAEECNFCMSDSYECQHPEMEDNMFISPGTEFIYNITKDLIKRTIFYVEEIIKDGAAAMRNAKMYGGYNLKHLDAMRELWKLVEDNREIPVSKTVSNVSELYRKIGKPVTDYVYMRVINANEITAYKKDISLKEKTYLDFSLYEKAKSMLILGNTSGFFGQYLCDGENVDIDEDNTDIEKHARNIISLKNLIKNGCKITVIANESTVEYYRTVARFILSCRECEDKDINEVFTFIINNDDNELLEKLRNENMPKFDYIIQNPPYKKTLYLDVFNMSLDLLSDSGKMVIVCPATWLVNIRDNAKDRMKFDNLKKKLNKHVKSVHIEQLSGSFNIAAHFLFSVIYYDKSQIYSEIEYNNCGLIRTVRDLNDCNLAGNMPLIKSILHKCMTYPIDKMKQHVCRKTIPGMSYLRYAEIMSSSEHYSANTDIVNAGGVDYFASVITPCIHQTDQEIYDELPKIKIRGKILDKDACCIYGSREELENWKHFINVNKLPKFINAILTIDQNNVSLPYIPWLVDKKFTDEEINKKFGFSNEEIKLIEYTLKKYEWKSAWFQRMFTGNTSIKVNQEKPWVYAR